MEDQTADQAHAPELRDRWEGFLNVRHEFASELDRMASDLRGKGRRQLQSLGRWFRGPAKFEDAMERPDVLAFCLPLIKSADRSLSTERVNQAARRGFCTVSRFRTSGGSPLRLLFYPFLILIAACLLWIGFSFWIAPQFQKMFEEFGIQIPKMTLLILGLANTVRHWWWLVLVVPVGAALLWFWNRIGTDRRTGNQTWLDQRLTSTRNALATWAWHVSLLLEAGSSQSDAIKTAGLATANARLRQVSLEVTGSGQLDALGQEEPFLFDPRFELLDCAMRMPKSQGKIALLREVATYYWDRNRHVSDWWIHWLVAILLCFILAAIVITIFSLFTPLIAIISGLTSTK